MAKFKRWRLAQDPETGLVVLFGVLDSKYIATHTTTPFSNYFDPHLLRDLETELHVKIISSSNDGLRYGFILEQGQIDELPEHIDAYLDDKKLVVRVVYNEKSASSAEASQNTTAKLNTADNEEQGQVDRSVGSYLRVFNDLEPGVEVVKPHAVQNPPDVIIEVKTQNNQQ